MADTYSPEELKQAEALYAKGLSYSEIGQELQKQKVLKQTSGDVALRVLKSIPSMMTSIPTLLKAAIPGTKAHEAAIEGVSQFAQHPLDSVRALASSLAFDPQTGQFDPGAMGESFGSLLGGLGLAKLAPALNTGKTVNAASHVARSLAASPEAQTILGRAGGTIVGTAAGHPLPGYLAGEALKPLIRGGATKFANLADFVNRPIGSLLGQNAPPEFAPRIPLGPPTHPLLPAQEPHPISMSAGSADAADVAGIQARLQQELRGRAIPPAPALPPTPPLPLSDRLWTGGDRTTGHFVEGPGGLSDLAAGRITRDVLPPALAPAVEPHPITMSMGGAEASDIAGLEARLQQELRGRAIPPAIEPHLIQMSTRGADTAPLQATTNSGEVLNPPTTIKKEGITSPGMNPPPIPTTATATAPEPKVWYGSRQQRGVKPPVAVLDKLKGVLQPQIEAVSPPRANAAPSSFEDMLAKTDTQGMEVLDPNASPTQVNGSGAPGGGGFESMGRVASGEKRFLLDAQGKTVRELTGVGMEDIQPGHGQSIRVVSPNGSSYQFKRGG
jgi:hypothetical protein